MGVVEHVPGHGRRQALAAQEAPAWAGNVEGEQDCVAGHRQARHQQVAGMGAEVERLLRSLPGHIEPLRAGIGASPGREMRPVEPVESGIRCQGGDVVAARDHAELMVQVGAVAPRGLGDHRREANSVRRVLS